MRILVSWVREFVDVSASPQEIADSLGLRGFEVASFEPMGGNDGVIDFEVTANRPDCLSVVGFAREIAAAFDRPLTFTPAPRRDAAGAHPRLRVTIEDDELCPRYAAAVADLRDTSSPAWMTDRLHAAGVRPISPIVDVTNYVLMELGHPLHAFDLDTLDERWLRIRRAGPKEQIRTLDNVARTLDDDMLVIADAKRPQAVAGVMGGAASEVSAATRSIAFESAYFKPASVRRTSKRLGLKTEASSRFERGCDVNAPMDALVRALTLMEQIGAGRTDGSPIDVYPNPRAPQTVRLRSKRLHALLGLTVPDRDVHRILTALGLVVTDAPDGWDVRVPTFRVDLVREVDLIEEVGRHYGFDRLEASFPVLREPPAPPDPRVERDQRLRRVLTAAGFTEAVTFGFVEADAAAPFVAVDASAVAIANPLSAKFDTLRPSLLPGLIDAVAHNRRHGVRDVALFEIAARFTSTGETRAIGLAATGQAAEHWASGSRAVDFFDAKGAVERACDVLGVTPGFEPADVPYLVPGRTARVSIGDSPVGVVGMLQPSIADRRGAPKHEPIFVAELNLDRIDALRIRTDSTGDDRAVRALPRYPAVVRDLSVVVAESLPAEIIRGTIHAASGRAAAPLAAITFFDRYKGKELADDRVSLSVRLTFQSAERTLTDADVQQSIDTILAALVGEHGAVQR